jgi:hypothetical protein
MYPAGGALRQSAFGLSPSRTSSESADQGGPLVLRVIPLARRCRAAAELAQPVRRLMKSSRKDQDENTRRLLNDRAPGLYS